jgi:NHLM bacteriocin system ABC transporter ATP-binding protein
VAASMSIRVEKLSAEVPRSAFCIEDPSSIWWIKSGKLDLFLTPTRDENSFGARHHVLRVKEGQAVFGVGQHIQHMTMLASPTPGTSIVRISLRDLSDMILAKDASPGLLLLEDWLTTFALAVSEDCPVGPFVTLESGQTVTIPQPTRAVFPKQGLVWVTHQKGGSFFRNAFFLEGDIPLVNGDSFFPLTKQGWLQAAGDSELSAIDSLELCKLDPDLEGIRLFHAITMSFLALKHQTIANRHRELMEKRAAADTAAVHSAFLQLTAPIQKVQSSVASADTCRNPALLACEVVGKHLGLQIKPPLEMLNGSRVADPLNSIARASGIRIRSVALKGNWWKQNAGPFIAFVEKGNKAVALLPQAGRYDLIDPSKGTKVIVSQEVAATLNPFAYVLYRPFPAKKLTLFDLLKFSLPSGLSELVVIVLMGMGAGIMGMLMPAAIGIIFDYVIPGADRLQLLQMAIFLVIVALATAMFNFVRGFAVLRLEGKLDASLQAAVWDRLLSLPVWFFRKYSAGDLAQRSLGFEAIRQTLTGTTMSGIVSGIFSIFSFALLFYYSWNLALVATGLVLIAFLVTTVCGIVQVRLQKQLAEMNGSLSSMLLQFITGIAKFRVSGTENRAFAVWARRFSAKKRVAVRGRQVSTGLTVFISVFPFVSLAIIFYAHQQFMASPDGKITTGDFMAFFTAFAQFLSSLLVFSGAIIAAAGTIPIYERVLPILDALPEVTEAKVNPGKLTGAVEVSHVSFRYGEDAPSVLCDVSINVLPGQFVAIVGPSGSGKSTLLRLLLGFEVPHSGAVYYDGQDLSGLDVQAVRRQMGVVLQSSRPINGSIFQNIVGSAPLSVDDAWQAARLAGIEQDIKQMPMGLHTQLSDGGGGISGGQRQRLMIARAIATRPRIMLFDEATSALDNQTQAIVSRSLESLRATRIVIAHRLSTVLNADCIYVLDKGSIVQAGTYRELIEKEGMFAELAKRQMI